MAGPVAAATGAAKRGATAGGKVSLSSESIQEHYRLGKRSSNMSAEGRRQISIGQAMEGMTKKLVQNSTAFMSVMGPILEVIGLFWDALVIAFLPIIIEVIKGLANNARRVLEWAMSFRSWLQEHMELVKAIAFGIVVAITIVIAAILIIAVVIGVVIALIGLIIGVLWQIGIIIGAVIGFVIDVLWAIGTFIGEFLWSIGEFIGNLIWGVIEFFVNIFTGVMDPITAVIKFIGDMVKAVVDLISSIFGGIGDFVGGVGDALGTAGGWVSGAVDWLNPF